MFANRIRQRSHRAPRRATTNRTREKGATIRAIHFDRKRQLLGTHDFFYLRLAHARALRAL